MRCLRHWSWSHTVAKWPASGLCIPLTDGYRVQLHTDREGATSNRVWSREVQPVHLWSKSVCRKHHKPLEVIYQKPPVAAPKRLQRMLLRLQKYDFEIYFKLGKHMYLADTLSRAPLSRNDEVLSIEKEIEEIRMVDFLPICSASLEDIRRESLKDSSIQALQKVIKSGWPETQNDLPVQVTPYFDVRDQLSVEDGIVFKGERCLIPMSQAQSSCQHPPITHWHRKMFETCQRVSTGQE